MGRNQAVRRQDPRLRQQTRLQSDRNPASDRNLAQTVDNRQQGSSKKLLSKLLSKLIRIFRRYPLLLVLTVWLVFLLLASLAIANMMSLDASKRSGSASLSPLTSAPVAAPILTPSASAPVTPLLPNSSVSEAAARHPEQGLPLLSLIAIALTCATGCIVLLRCLQPRRPAKRLQPLTARSTAAGKNRRISPEASRFQSSSSAGSPGASSPGTVEASLVPQEVNQPLDWDEPSLADSLDLRQRQPLSRWLQSDW